MQSTALRLSLQRHVTAGGVVICSPFCPRRAYGPPTYPVNATDLPDPRGPRPEVQQRPFSLPQPAYREQHPHEREGSHSSSSSSSGSGRPQDESTSSDGNAPFTKLDLQNPPQMPSPTYYATYEEYLDAYDHYLRDTGSFTTSARVFVQRRFERLRAAQADVAEVVRSEYLWTFVPLMFCLSVFMIDRSNHSAALYTHRVIKERTKQQEKHVKWETI